MHDSADGSSGILQLFAKYSEHYDPDHDLRPPEPDCSIAALWQSIEQQRKISSQELAEQLAAICGVPLHDGELVANQALLKRIPRRTADEFLLLPVGVDDGLPVFVIANPCDQDLINNLGFLLGGAQFKLELSTPAVLEIAIASAYDAISETGQRRKARAKMQQQNGSALQDQAIPRLAHALMTKALAQKASDMHVQPFVGGSVVRIRVDGLLKRLTILPESVAQAVIRYFKAQSAMDPTLIQVPQDGRMLVEIEGHEFDLRLSTLPVTGRQEKLVIRFLNRQSVFSLSAIGFSLDEIHVINRLASSPSGVILVCGPTGSGKTTTLYSILAGLNTEDTSIMTVENPVEYQMAGLSQTEINDKAGMTFPRALRAILRQDPDILLIGEIRDAQTAQIALQSALTGHLVFSTLHTNDSLSAIPRLLDLGVKPIIMAESLSGIMSQRLVRTLCVKCKVPLGGEKGDPAAEAFHVVTRSPQGCKPVGCEHCEFSGYKGRTVIAELVEIGRAQRELLLGGESDVAKFKSSLRGTFNSLSMSASRLIISGITSAAEVYSVIGPPFWFELAEEYRSEVPDLGSLSTMTTGKASAGVLIAGEPSAAMQELGELLREGWFAVEFADSAGQAEQVLRNNINMAMVIVSIPSFKSDEEVIGFVADYRAHMAWSRLPALLRIPDQHPEYEELLRQHGATSRFVPYGMPLEDVVDIIQDGLNRRADFKWGMQNTQ